MIQALTLEGISGFQKRRKRIIEVTKSKARFTRGGKFLEVRVMLGRRPPRCGRSTKSAVFSWRNRVLPAENAN
jgi:hypothetical protein